MHTLTDDALSALRVLMCAGVLTRPSSIIMVLLTSDTHGITVSSIANKLGLPMNSVSMTVTDLETSGTVERRFPHRDQRTVNVYLTQKGEERAAVMILALAAMSAGTSQT